MKLVDVARKLIEKDGVDALTVRNLAAVSGREKWEVETEIGSMAQLRSTLFAVASIELGRSLRPGRTGGNGDPKWRATAAGTLVDLVGDNPHWFLFACSDVPVIGKPPTDFVAMLEADPLFRQITWRGPLGSYVAAVLSATAYFFIDGGDRSAAVILAEEHLDCFNEVSLLLRFVERTTEVPSRSVTSSLSANAGQRERILDAASRLVKERGIEAVSFRDVAAASLYGKSTVHDSVGGRAGLVDMLRQKARADLVRELMSEKGEHGEREQPPETAEKWSEYFDRWSRYILANPHWAVLSCDRGANWGTPTASQPILFSAEHWMLAAGSPQISDFQSRAIVAATELVIAVGDSGAGGSVISTAVGTLSTSMTKILRAENPAA